MVDYNEIINNGKMLEIFAASYFQTMEYFVESNLKWLEDKEDETGNADVLELDVIAKVFIDDKVDSVLIECKRGCTYNDLFKFSGVSKLVGCDKNLLLCQSHEYKDLKKIGKKIGIDLITPEELLKNINNDKSKLKFDMLMSINDICNKLLDKDTIRRVLCNGKKFSSNEINAYNRIRSYMSILIGKIWREPNYGKRVNWINELLIDNKDFVREISRVLEMKPGNKYSEYYMNTNALCQAAGYLVLKVKISYIVSAIECAINISDDCIENINDEALRHLVRILSENISIAIKIPKFLQNFIYIFGGVYSELDNDLHNIAKFIGESEADLRKIIHLLKELFTLKPYGIQWGFNEDMCICSLKYVPIPIKGIGIQNRKLLGFQTDVFCFKDQWLASKIIWGDKI